jgi:ATP-dependent Clp protease ATP-binding subunit ClpA
MAKESFIIKKLTQKAHKALETAHHRALASDKPTIASEHLLAGLLDDPEGIAVRLINSLGINIDTIKHDLDQVVTPVEPDYLAPRRLPLAVDLEQALRFSADEAKKMGMDFVGTEHLLLGLLRSPEGLGNEILTRHGLALGPVRNQLHELMTLQRKAPAEPMETASSAAQETKGSGLQGFTAKALKAVEKAHEESFKAGRRHVGTDHLMLGLLSDPENAAVKVLKKFTDDIEGLIKELRKLSRL